MASELRVNTLKDASGNNSVGMSTVAEGSAKSWYCLQGSDTFAVRDSFNTASATDNGEGDYTTVRTNAFSNDDYATAALCSSTAGSNAHYNFTVENQDNRLRSTTSLRTYILNSQSGEGANDALDSSVVFFGDLA
jgi:hypothetical protein